MSPETKLLLFTCAHFDEENERQVRSLVDSVDWRLFPDLCTKHDVCPMVYKNLSAFCRDNVPEKVLAGLRNQFFHNMIQNTYRVKELIRVLDMFPSQPPLLLPFRGPVLAERLYGDVGFRQFLDLDVWAEEKHILNILKKLIRNGYAHRERLTPEQVTKHLRRAYHFPLFQEKSKIILEIHWKIMPDIYFFKYDYNGIWQRSEQIRLNGRSVPCFSLDDEFMLNCLHAARHNWEGLKWVCDTAFFIRHIKDWQWIFSQAEKFGYQRIINVGIYLARELLGAVPDKILAERIDKDSRARALGEDTIKQLLGGQKSDEGWRKGILLSPPNIYLIRIRERKRERAVIFFHLIVRSFMPKKQDKEWISLPVWLSPLYFFFRPIRLLTVYVPKIWKDVRNRLWSGPYF